MTYLESLDVSVLFFFKIMKETNFNLVLICVAFLGMELVKKVIGVMIPLATVFVFLGMEHKMFYQLPHIPVSPISSIDPLPNLFPKESPTYISKHPPIVSEFPPSISNTPFHTSDEPPAPIINVPIDIAPAMDSVDPSDSPALHRSHRVTTLPSHLRDFHCFSTLASL